MGKNSSTRLVTVNNPQGLHARPAHALVNLASQFQANIELTREGSSVDAKSILGIMTLAAEQGTQLTVRATGDDAEEALNAIERLFADGLGENGKNQPKHHETETSS